MIKHLATASLMVLASGSPILAQTIYPIDRAEILAGARFDLKVEFPDRSTGEVDGDGQRRDHAARRSARRRPSSRARTARISRR